MRQGPLSEARIRALVADVRDGIVAIEGDWVEWKRSLDFSTTKGRFPLPKNVLGMANRMPETALRNLDGRGYILVGVEPGSIVGMNPVDPAEFHNWIDPYVKATGPDWQLHYVKVEDKTVAVIEVAPPRPGDPIHALRKECSGFRRGTIFVRKNGKTHPADDQDIENLTQRAQGAHLDFDLLLIGAERISWFDRSVVEAEIKRIADRSRVSQLEHAHSYRAGSESETPLTHTLRRAMAEAYPKERRSLHEYESEVDEWHTEWTHDASQHWVENYIVAGHGVHSLRLRNLTDQNFASVEVRLQIERVQVEDDIPSDAVELPERPRRFGQGTSLLDIGHIDRAILMQRVDFPTSFDLPEFSVIQLEGAVEVAWNAGHLRPVDSIESAELCILVDAPQDSNHFAITWSATSTSVNGVFEGVLEIPLAAHPISFDDFEHDLHI